MPHKLFNVTRLDSGVIAIEMLGRETVAMLLDEVRPEIRKRDLRFRNRFPRLKVMPPEEFNLVALAQALLDLDQDIEAGKLPRPTHFDGLVSMIVGEYQLNLDAIAAAPNCDEIIEGILSNFAELN